MYHEYLGDKKALEQIKNCSICIKTYDGIRNIKSYHDVLNGELVYVENIPFYSEGYGKAVTNHIIKMDEMVRYRCIKTNANNRDRKIVVYGSDKDRAYEKLNQILNKVDYSSIKRINKSEYLFTADLINGDRYVAVTASDNARGHRWQYAYIDSLIDYRALDLIVLPSGLPGCMYEYY